MNIAKTFNKSKYHHQSRDHSQPQFPEHNLKKYISLLDQFNLNPRLAFDEDLNEILDKLSKKQQLSKSQANWLFSHGNSTFLNSTVSKAFYTTEAIWNLESYKESNAPCTLIDAANCYIAANNPEEALRLLDQEDQIQENKNSQVINFYYQAKALAQLGLGQQDDAYTTAIQAHKAVKENVDTTLLLMKLSFLSGNTEDALKWEVETKNNGCAKDKIHEAIKDSIRLIEKPQKRFEVVLKLFSNNYAEYKYLRNFLPKKMQSQNFGAKGLS